VGQKGQGFPPSPVAQKMAAESIDSIDYAAMDGDEEFDEDLHGDWDESLNINWFVFLSRVFSLLCVVVMVVCAGLGLIKTRFLFLAGIAMATFCLCFGLSYMECCRKRCSSQYVSRFSFSHPPPPPSSVFPPFNSTDEKRGKKPHGDFGEVINA